MELLGLESKSTHVFKEVTSLLLPAMYDSSFCSLSKPVAGARVRFVLALQFNVIYCFYLICISLATGNVGSFKYELLLRFDL